MSDCDVLVVGSGPNGLSAAVTCARAGLDVAVIEAQETIGGGARTVDRGLAEGVVHDLCSAVHPMALASPFFVEFDLPARGVDLIVPDVSYAQPLDGGRAGIAHRSLEVTVDGLGMDGPAWHALFAPLSRQATALTETLMADHRALPSSLLTAARFGVRALEQGGPFWQVRFGGEAAPALLTGVAAHANTRLPSTAAAGAALMLGALAHACGWPIPRGGSQTVTDALVADLHAHGGRITTSEEATDLAALPSATATIFDTSPATMAAVVGDRFPQRYHRAVQRFGHGSGVAKVDFVLSAPVPWRHPDVARAGTVHLGGTRTEVVAAEAEVAAGRHAARPVVLVSDPAVVDPSRIGPGGRRPFWTYAHVPYDSPDDVTETVTAQVERFAPGFRDVVVASSCIPARHMSAHDANYSGGDIGAGTLGLRRLLVGPILRADPYSTPLPDVFLASSSVPPGPGVHGMCGLHAARRVLARRFGVKQLPSLSPVA